MLRKKRDSDVDVFYRNGISDAYIAENKVFRIKRGHVFSGDNTFAGLRFNNFGDVRFRNCTFINYDNPNQTQMRAIGFAGGGGNVDIQYCTFIGCAYAVMFTGGTYASFILKNNIILEPKNSADTSMKNDARFAFFFNANFTNYAEIDKNRWQSIEGMGGDIINTYGSSKIKVRENQFLGKLDTTRTNTVLSGLGTGGGTLVIGDDGGSDQEYIGNVICNTSAFGVQIVDEALRGDNIVFQKNKVLIEQKSSTELGYSQMAGQIQNCYDNFVFSQNRLRGYKHDGVEQGVYTGNYYDTCGNRSRADLLLNNKDNDHTIKANEILPNRIV